MKKVISKRVNGTKIIEFIEIDNITSVEIKNGGKSVLIFRNSGEGVEHFFDNHEDAMKFYNEFTLEEITFNLLEER